MPSCLGLYIEDNLIKYAKLSKERDDIKIDTFGIKFYDKIEEAIKQIVAETYSYKVPISVSLSGENYNYFYMFNLLSKKDLESAIKTEFESLCTDKGYNKNALETRYALVDSVENKEKIKVVHVSANKAEIGSILKDLEGNRVNTITTLPISIANLIDANEKENIAIINIEERTSITTIINNKIENIDILEEGSKEFLDKINLKENSFSKAYNICKEATIYTSAGKDLVDEQASEYLDDIMPTLYNIVSKARKLINERISEIDRIYITGTGAIINNIDLYFNEYFSDIKCEVLKPYFIRTTKAKINIKDYIEVNSAIALALQGLGVGVPGMNFKKENFKDKLPEWLTADIGKGGSKKASTSKINLHMDLKEPLDRIEGVMLRTAVGIFAFILLFGMLSKFLTGQMRKKANEIQEVITDTQTQMAVVTQSNSKINAKITKYESMIENLNKLNNEISEKYQYRDAIPNLLTQLMSVIPKNVQITSIENTSGRHIKIIAQAEEYDQLGFFKAEIKNSQVLNDVISDQGVRQNNMIVTTIEGELP